MAIHSWNKQIMVIYIGSFNFKHDEQIGSNEK